MLYIGVTNNLKRRLYEHNNPKRDVNSFTKRYNVFYLVYYETHNNIILAIQREKEIKKWRREKKDALISAFNKNWDFLNDEV